MATLAAYTHLAAHCHRETWLIAEAASHALYHELYHQKALHIGPEQSLQGATSHAIGDRAPWASITCTKTIKSEDHQGTRQPVPMHLVNDRECQPRNFTKITGWSLLPRRTQHRHILQHHGPEDRLVSDKPARCTKQVQLSSHGIFKPRPLLITPGVSEIDNSYFSQ
jgi:hypothetical protein